MAMFYAISNKPFMAAILLLGLLMCSLQSVQSIGVCNGGSGNNLPSAAETVGLYKSNGIGSMRIYDPNQETLQALRGSNIELILDVSNDKLQSFASDASAATQWVQSNVVSYSPAVRFKYISVGNEVQSTSGTTQYVLPAMQNILNAIVAAGLQSQIKVSTAIDIRLLGNTHPPAPSQGTFSDAEKPFISPIISFLASNGAPLLVNVYPYFSYAENPPYALFTSPGVVVSDGNLGYQNLFDAMLDAVYSAVEKVGGASVKIVVSESGWPSQGDVAATVANAATYNRNLINHVKGGTPKRPGAIETYLFAMFDENEKPGPETEQHFGLFNPISRQLKYQISFT